MSDKRRPSATLALEGLLFDGMTIMSGGFGLSGNPEHLNAVLASEVKTSRSSPTTAAQLA